MKLMSVVLTALVSFGCGATVDSQLVKKDARLASFKKVHLMIETAGSAVSISEASMGVGMAKLSQNQSGISVAGVGTSHSVSRAMSGNDQAIMAAQDLMFGLRELGFETVDRIDDADAIALFSIGTVRYDPLAGWIADKAHLQFKENRTGSIICSIKAESQVVTPTVEKLVNGLLSEVKRYY
ncbi:MAG: hypothetical protein GDA67_07700 [Nitrospira sp. CR1.3]|nr:hypothetical protein [Nitrospira sp. CR1.3]